MKEEIERIAKETERIKKISEELENEILTDEAEFIANGRIK